MKKTKKQLLAKIPVPTGYPTNAELTAFLKENGCENLLTYGDDLHAHMTLEKWHHFNGDDSDHPGWVKIRDWRKYFTQMEERLREWAVQDLN